VQTKYVERYAVKDRQIISPVKNPEGRMLMLTLSVRADEILRVESFDEYGNKYDVPDVELAALVGDYEIEDLLSVLEQVCVYRYFDEEDNFDFDDTEIKFDNDLEPVVVGRIASHRLIRNGIKKLILRRLLARACVTERERTAAPVQSVFVNRKTCH
jgi:hypothetical protein